MTQYQIQAAEGLSDTAYTPYGGCAEFFYCKDREFIAEGPAETGKTLAACWKVHMLALKYPGLNGAIVRKTQKSVYGSVLQTFERVIKDAPVEPYGGSRPEQYIYKNGSVIWVGGMDNPDKVLSSERDFFYVNQAEELNIDDWEKMTTRTTGRGAVMPYTMTFGDCNPGGSKHWIKARAQSGNLRLIHTTHKDNPRLYDRSGNLTDDGRRTMETLEALTGVRRKRLLEGSWAAAEGAIFENIILREISDMEIAQFDRPLRGIDWGYFPDPFSFGLMHYSAAQRTLYIYGEYRAYRQRPLQTFDELEARELITVIENRGAKAYPDFIIADSAEPGSIADYRSKGANIRGAEKGPDTVRRSMEWLQGLVAIVIDPARAPGHAQEFSDCQYQIMRNGEYVREFVDGENHSIDDTRYATNLLWRQRGE